MKNNRFSLEEFGTFFRSQLIEAIKSDYEGLKKKIKSEQPCSLALVTDSDFSSLFLAVNTVEYVNKKREKIEEDKKLDIELFSEYLSEKDLNNLLEDHDENLNSLQWIPDEWRNGDNDLKNSKISLVSQYLHDSVIKLKLNYSKFKIGEKIIEEITFSLKEIIDEGFWENNDIFFFVSMSDDKRAKKIENYSAEILNDKLVYDLFLKRFD
ncbi:DUF4303 domain-containing protein [Flavobacterium johnsoniae]|uniref:DUF4303 domain-containing protein n=1 Tax=Flavobacterium johnsoniae TaxID=986 RepID=UPI0011EEF403|nr:DUF4303 domain-containing protein [Flavobacterium johnsoniae]